MKKVKKRKGNYNGLPGAIARAKKLSPKRRYEIARNAARARWSKVSRKP